ncbi:putative odorant receptor 85d [Anthonomus grandis grandis]|uniref:putative odorant receptor 85d n=1 Tax=Anthonomus grandis grandis TaxID=2921223 RepID=UPI002165FFFD|nr:putative odorant receptor 85d [Anthonomus grandis grandis]
MLKSYSWIDNHDLAIRGTKSRFNKIYKISNFLNIERFCLGIGGFYPTRIKRTPLIKLSTLFVYFITFGQMWVVTNFVVSTTDLSEISEVFLFSMTQVGFVSKLMNFLWRIKQVPLLDQMLEQEIFTRVTTEEMTIWKGTFKRVQRYLVIFLSLCAGVVVLYGVIPAIENTKSDRKHYPFPGRFPFDPDRYYYVIYIGEVVAVAVSAFMNGSGLDCLFTKHTVIATVMFKILCGKIEGLLDNVDKGERSAVEKRIRHCIVYYNEAVNYVSLVDRIFSYGILVQFLCSAVVICLTGFQMMLVMSFQSVKLGLMAIYFTCMMCQLILYCWHGHMLMEQSRGITQACYSVDWNNMTIKEQKMLILIMERAKKPITIKAAGVFHLNLATLMAILRSSYSYFAVLRQLYNKTK